MSRKNLAPRVDFFLIGTPKSGTTWLSNVLTQHPGISTSYPKEINEITSHKGTFVRDESEPNWKRYERAFSSNGKRIDCSISTFSCPLAPGRISDHWPDAKFILCLREPVSRTISHWRMILETGEDLKNGENWEEFAEAWKDQRLQENSLYGRSMQRWLSYFPRDRFHLIGVEEMRKNPEKTTESVFAHMGVEGISLNTKNVFSNPGSSRRVNNSLGNIISFLESALPGKFRVKIANFLRSRGLNPYKLPIFSKKIMDRSGQLGKPYSVTSEMIVDDLEVLSRLTDFDVSDWLSEIEEKKRNENIHGGL